MEYLERNFEGDEHHQRKEQTIQGLRMGHEEVIKMTRRYMMRPPLVLLILSHQIHSGPFLRAVLSVLSEHQQRQAADDNTADYAVLLINNPG